MKPISIGKFALGIGFIGLFWLAWKPMMDELNDIVAGIGYNFEVSYFQLVPIIILVILGVGLLIKVTKRHGDG